MFITAAPTGSPTKTPSLSPTTLVPSAQPSITGLVVTLDMSRPVEEDLTTEELTAISDAVLTAYGVTEEDVTTDVAYTASGSLELDLPAGISTEEVEESVASNLADVLGVHPRDVTVVSVDLETGEVVYTVSSDSYSDTALLQTQLEGLDLNALEESLQEDIPGANIVNNVVQEEIVADVSVVVDGSAADNVGQGNTEALSALATQGFNNVAVDVAIVTASPSVSPSFTTTVPTASPSVTGVVVTLSLSKTGEILTAEELEAFAEDIATSYGVAASDVDIQATYAVSGTMQLDTLPEGVTQEELETFLEQGIADSLGVHPRDVTVAVDPESGTVTYTVTSEDNSSAQTTQASLDTADFLSSLNENLAEANDALVVTAVEAEPVVMDVVVTVDATEATADVTETSSQIVQDFESQGYSADTESKFLDFWLRIFF